MRPVLGEALLQEWFDYFADCHAATILSLPKSASKSQRRRLANIAEMMIPLAKDQETVTRLRNAVSFVAGLS